VWFPTLELIWADVAQKDTVWIETITWGSTMRKERREDGYNTNQAKANQSVSKT
jgi:hypothetical protein